MRIAKFLPFFFLIPALFVIFFAMIYPMALVFLSSFFNVSIDLKYQFVGLANFINMFSDSQFLQSLTNSIVFVGGSVVCHCGFGLLLAILLTGNIKFREFYRTVALIPWFLSDVIIGTCFIILFTQYGTVNDLLFGLFKIRISWLQSTELTIYIVTLANVWKATSLYMNVDSSGIASISSEVLESAELDGTNSIQKFRYITAPLIKPFILLTLIISAVGTFNYYGLIYIMTYGGPIGSTTVPSFYMFREALEYRMIGYASAIGVFIFATNMTVLTVLRKFGATLA